MIEPKITFLVSTHDRASLAIETLARVEAAAGQMAHEIILVDNASTDGTVDLVEGGFPHVRRIELPTNLPAAGWNLGLAAAAAPFVFMLSPGTWPEQGTTRHALRQMAENPRLAVAGCYVRRAGQSRIRLAADLPGSFSSGAAVLRREAVVQAGGFAIDYGGCFEEHDLSARLWQAGWQVRQCRQMVVGRDGHPGSAPRLATQVASRLRFWLRYAPPEHRQQRIEAVLDYYRSIAEQQHAVPEFEEAIVIGLAEDAARIRCRPLSESHYAQLVGSEAIAVRVPAVAQAV